MTRTMTLDEAVNVVMEGVGLNGEWDEAAIDALAREAASAREYKDWETDCGWRSNPQRASRRITLYLDSFIESDGE